MNHGKKGNVLARNENGFIGDGLDDLTPGVFSSALDSAYFEIEIDAEGAPDTFKWRENGGAYTEGVALTGAAQTLAGANGDQIITFNATTGHALGDKWVVGNLKNEPCTLDHDNFGARVTDAAMQVLNPNNPPVFTDSGGANVIHIDYARGTAHFDADPTSVTVTGANGYVPAAALETVGYMYGWSFDGTVDLAPIPSFQDNWKKYLAGLAGAAGECESYFNSEKWFNRMNNNAERYFLLHLFTYDPDADGTGDHFVCWVHIDGYSLGANLSGPVAEKLKFTLDGAPGFVANS